MGMGNAARPILPLNRTDSWNRFVIGNDTTTVVVVFFENDTGKMGRGGTNLNTRTQPRDTGTNNDNIIGHST